MAILCDTCKYFTTPEFIPGQAAEPHMQPKCKAFPKGIPADILDGTVQHTEPYKGDRGLQYAPQADDAKEDGAKSRFGGDGSEWIVDGKTWQDGKWVAVKT